MPNSSQGSQLRYLKGNISSLSNLPPSAATGDAYLIGRDMYIWNNSGWAKTDIYGPMGSSGVQGVRGPIGVPLVSVFMTFSNGKFCLVDLEEEMLDSFGYPMFPTEGEIALFSMTYPAKGRRISLMYNQ